MTNQIERVSFQKADFTDGSMVTYQFVDCVYPVGSRRGKKIRVTFRYDVQTNYTTVTSEYWNGEWIEVFGPKRVSGKSYDVLAAEEEAIVMGFLEER